MPVPLIAAFALLFTNLITPSAQAPDGLGNTCHKSTPAMIFDTLSPPAQDALP